MAKVKRSTRSVQTDISTLQDMLQYELHAAERYRRFVTLLLIDSRQEGSSLEEDMKRHLRSSDVMARIDNSIAVLMGETDNDGARIAAERYKKDFGRHAEFYFSLATYPADGGKPERLFTVAHERLEKSRAESSSSTDSS